MTRIFNKPENFVDDALTGLAAAYPQYITRIHGGVVRSTASPEGEVAVVVGGGSGHFPAFAGWVGPGLAHGAVCGNIFASPSASQAYSIMKAVDSGAGVLMTFGNYAGDVLHFGQAAAQLRAEGHDIRIVTVSDDVASNPPEKHRERRGVAGDVVVFKIAGAAAERGMSLDEVEAVAWRANDMTRSMGVAFDGCTLPGADHPLFHVPEGQMSIGLGVHGEPGIYEVPLGTAEEIADLLVDGVLAEEPDRDANGYHGRAIVLVNGLGTIKVEEMAIVYARVAQRLAERDITPVLPEIGELITSLDMAGISLTITYLDDELEALWTDPVETIAVRRGAVGAREERTDLPEDSDTRIPMAPIEPGSVESQALAGKVVEILKVVHATMTEQERALGDIDAIAGDGDHGQGMLYGSTGGLEAAQEALAAGAGAGTLLGRAGAQWSESAGGTSGALWGAMLTAIGTRLGDADAASAELVAQAVRDGVDAVMYLGGAQLGDKTMVDSLVPFADELQAAVTRGSDLSSAWASAAEKAVAAAEATKEIVSKRGRSRVLGEKSIGTPDPGALSLGMIVTAIAQSGLLGSS